MAESQVPFPYTAVETNALRASLSEARFAPYLARGGNHTDYAFALYLYNSRLAKAFLYPLSVAEVTLRNAIDGELVRKFGANWHLDPTFRDQTLTEMGRITLDKAIERAGANAPKDQIVATLTFDFWSNLFRPDYGDFWRTSLNIILPNIPRGGTRHDVQNLVKAVNAFRNRVAHHEPILDQNVNDIYGQIVELIALRCQATARWMSYHATVAAAVRTRPRLDGSAFVSLASRLDSQFVSVSGDEDVRAVMAQASAAHPAIVQLDEQGAPMSACTIFDMVGFVLVQADAADGLVGLQDHKVSTVLSQPEIMEGWRVMAETSAFALAIKELQKPRVQLLVGVDSATGKATGAIMRAHRRY